MLACGLCPAVPAAAGAVTLNTPPVPATPAVFTLGSLKSSTYVIHRGRKTWAQFTMDVRVHSQNEVPVTITGIGRSGAGLKLLSPEKRDPYVLEPGQSVRFSLKYEITSCNAVQQGDWPIPIRVRTDDGESIAYASLLLSKIAPKYRVNAPWQAALAEQACTAR
ncbi:hypothetical protein [Streptosporangium sp. NPDC003464]